MGRSIWTETEEETLQRKRRQIRKRYLSYEKDLIKTAHWCGELNKQIEDIDHKLWQLSIEKRNSEEE